MTAPRDFDRTDRLIDDLRSLFDTMRVLERHRKALRDGGFDEAFEPVAAALRVARASAPLLKPFVDTLRDEALK